MGVERNTTYTITCDRCEHTEQSDKDPRVVELKDWSWWDRIGPAGAWGTQQRLLCASCEARLQLFFEGPKTAAGTVYNAQDAARFLQAKLAASEYVDAERNAPWNN